MGCRRQRAMLLPFLTSINSIAPKHVQAHRIFCAYRHTHGFVKLEALNVRIVPLSRSSSRKKGWRY